MNRSINSICLRVGHDFFWQFRHRSFTQKRELQINNHHEEGWVKLVWPSTLEINTMLFNFGSWQFWPLRGSAAPRMSVTKLFCRGSATSDWLPSVFPHTIFIPGCGLETSRTSQTIARKGPSMPRFCPSRCAFLISFHTQTALECRVMKNGWS